MKKSGIINNAKIYQVKTRYEYIQYYLNPIFPRLFLLVTGKPRKPY